MSTRIYSIEQWRALDKTNWHAAILEWNRRKGHTKQVPRVATKTPLLDARPSDRRRSRKEQRAERSRPLWNAVSLTWDEVPQRLPYVHGRSKKELDPTKVYVCEDFLSLAEKRQRIEQVKMIFDATKKVTEAPSLSPDRVA